MARNSVYCFCLDAHDLDHLGGWTTEDVQYTFQGSPSVRHLVHHEASGRTRTEDYSYTYDNQERLLSVSHSLDGGTPVSLIENTYDDLGRLSSTGHASKTALEQAYSYNIRSQKTEIAGPLFSERLYYEQAPSASPLAAARYGGGISSMEWKAGSMSAFAGWDFSYDGIGRLTGSDYRLGNYLSGDYDTAYSYDDHGNILSIREEGSLTPLRTFTYTGNQLFGRLYDANGNLRGSLQQESLQINYNVLNLPELILRNTGSDTVRYAYAADGTKLCETVSKQGILSSKSDYAANRIYRDGNLRLLVTDGGYLAFPDSVAGTPTVPKHIFLLRDHLGSVRVVADTSGGVHQIHHYYPYGGDLLLDVSEPQEPGIGIIGEDPEEPGIIEPDEPIIFDPEEPIVADPDEPYLVLETTPNNPFMFIGKEKVGGRGLVFYDFGARFYLPGSPQWISMDPLAEKYYSISPYVYCAGNPVNLIDLKGEDWYIVNQKGEFVLIEHRDGEEFDCLFLSYNEIGPPDFTNSLMVNDQRILKSLTTTEDPPRSGRIADYEGIFFFVADAFLNTEWGLYSNGEECTIVTAQSNSHVRSPYENTTEKIHSHSDTSSDDRSELESMGYWFYDNKAFRDGKLVDKNARWYMANVSPNDYRNYLETGIPSKVYFPLSGHLYKINKGTLPTLIRTRRQK